MKQQQKELNHPTEIIPLEPKQLLNGTHLSYRFDIKSVDRERNLIEFLANNRQVSADIIEQELFTRKDVVYNITIFNDYYKQSSDSHQKNVPHTSKRIKLIVNEDSNDSIINSLARFGKTMETYINQGSD